MVPTPSLEYSSSSRAPSIRASTRCARFTPLWQAAHAAMRGRGSPDTYHFSKSISPEPVLLSALSVCRASCPAHAWHITLVCHLHAARMQVSEGLCLAKLSAPTCVMTSSLQAKQESKAYGIMQRLAACCHANPEYSCLFGQEGIDTAVQRGVFGRVWY